MSTSVQVKDLTPDETYYFVVTAISTGNLESGPSNEVQYKVPIAGPPPLAVNGSVTVIEDTTGSFTLEADPGTVQAATSTLVFNVTKPPTNGSLSGVSPNLTYHPAANFAGHDSVEFTVTSGTQTSEPGVIQIFVSPVNDPPVVKDTTVTLLEDTSASFVLSVTDPDGDPLIYSIKRLPSKGTLTGTPPNLTFTPFPNAGGPDYIDFTVTDGVFTSPIGKVYLAITPVNDAPIAIAKSLSVNAGASVAVVLQGTDVENSPLTFNVTRGPTGGTLSGSGANYTYTARADFSGQDSLEFTANDGAATSAPATISISVTTPTNTAPIAIAQSKTLLEDGTLAITLAGTDAESNPLTFNITRQPASGTLTGTAPNISYKPAANFNGSDYFEFTVHDGKVASASAKVSLTVTAVNDTPVAIAKSLSVNAGASVAVVLQGTDVENSALTFKVTRGPTGGTLTGSGANYTYTARADFSGSDSLEFTANDGAATSAPATISITVSPAPNTAPVAIAQSRTLLEDGTLAITLAGTDAESNPLTFSITRQPSNGTLTGTAPNISYKPAANFNGSDYFEFTVHDGKVASASAKVSLTITAVNDAPIAIAKSLSVNAGASVAVVLQGTDVENSPLTFKVTRGPTGGTLTGSGANYTYTARADFSGQDSLEFTANDGAATSASATISITVSPAPNTAPVAIAQSKTLLEDGTQAITLAGTDAESNPLTFSITRQPANGTLTGTAPNISYTPTANFNGSDYFEFTVHDGKVASASAKVSLTITAVNDAPIALAKSLSVNAGASVAVVLQCTDVENDPVTYSITRPPANGTLTGSAPNLSYKPAANFNGSDYFEFTVHDGKVASAPAKVSLTIIAISNAPVAKSIAVTLNEDNSAIVTLTGTGAPGKTLAYSVTTQPSNGRLIGNAPNLRYIPNNNYNGSDSFQFVVKDGTLTSAPGAVTLVIIPVNDAPLAINRSLSVAEDRSVSAILSGHDVDGDPLTIAISKAPLNGTLSGASPNYVYTPKTNYFGLDTFSFTVSDGTAAPATGKVSINIVSINDAPLAPNQSVPVLLNTAKSFKLAAYDVEGSPLTYYLRTKPINGTLAGTMPNLIYTPRNNYLGTDTLTYSVTDGAASSTIGTVTLSIGTAPVKPSDPQPDVLIVAASGTASSLIDGSNSVALNDASTDSTTVEVQQAPLHGTVELAADGRFTYRHTGSTEIEDSFSYVTVSDGVASDPAQVRVHIFQLAGLSQEGNEFVISFPVVAGVSYRVEGNTVSADASAPWQVLGELNPDVTAIAEVPTPAPSDGSGRYFRVTATDGNGTLTTEPFGFQRVLVEPGTQTYASPFQGTLVHRTQATSVTGNAIQLATENLAPGEWAPSNAFASHALVVAGTSQWWPILGNEGGQVVVDSSSADLSQLVNPGASLEIVRLSTAAQIFGTPGASDSALQPGDFADFVSGNGTVSTLECRNDADGVAGYFLHHGGVVSGPVSGSSITLLPGQPIQVQKSGVAGTLWFLGRVQSNPLTPYGVGSTGTTGFASE